METSISKTENSGFIENMIEHVFISEILQEAWLNHKIKLEILRSEVDDSGYDIVIVCNGIGRFIQLKTSELGGKTAKQKLNVELSKKDNGCIVWIVRTVSQSLKRFEFKYLFYGSGVGELVPDIAGLKVAKHTKANSKGIKSERPKIRDVPKRDFQTVETTSCLLGVLFNLK